MLRITIDRSLLAYVHPEEIASIFSSYHRLVVISELSSSVDNKFEAQCTTKFKSQFEHQHGNRGTLMRRIHDIFSNYLTLVRQCRGFVEIVETCGLHHRLILVGPMFNG